MHKGFAQVSSWESWALENIQHVRLQEIMDQLEELQQRAVRICQRLYDAYAPRVADAWQTTKQYSQDHPYIAIGITFSILWILPWLAFCCLAVGITLLGFIFVEGTLLTIGTVFLTCAVSILGFIALGIVSVAALSWLIFSALRNLLQHSRKLFYRRREPLENGSLPCEKNNTPKAETIAANTITFENRSMYKND